jgi:hypothetical protein
MLFMIYVIKNINNGLLLLRFEIKARQLQLLIVVKYSFEHVIISV